MDQRKYIRIEVVKEKRKKRKGSILIKEQRWENKRKEEAIKIWMKKERVEWKDERMKKG